MLLASTSQVLQPCTPKETVREKREALMKLAGPRQQIKIQMAQMIQMHPLLSIS